jgi:hypothetical protein
MLRSMVKCVSMSIVLCGTAFANETDRASAEQAQADAQSNYELHHVGLNVSGNRWTAYEGKPGNPLEGVDFYEKVGRKDLAEAYKSKTTTKMELEAIGSAAMVLGLVYAVISFDSTESCKVSTPTMHYGDCWDQQLPHDKVPQGFVGVGVALAGAGLLTWGLLLNPHPSDALQARQLVDDYNDRLRNELGLSVPQGPSPAEAPEVHLTLAPIINRSGGGVTLGVSF